MPHAKFLRWSTPWALMLAIVLTLTSSGQAGEARPLATLKGQRAK
jgi:hypothetical protein